MSALDNNDMRDDADRLLADIIAQLDQMITSAGHVMTACERLVTKIGEANELAEAFADATAAVNTKLMTAHDQFHTFIDTLQNEVAAAASAAEQSLETEIAHACGVIGNATERVGTIAETLDDLGTAMERYSDNIESGFQEAIDSVDEDQIAALELLNSCDDEVSELFDTIEAAFDDLGELVQGQIDDVVDRIAEEMRQPIDQCRVTIAGSIQDMRTYLADEIAASTTKFIEDSLTRRLNDEIDELATALRARVDGLVRSIEHEGETTEGESRALQSTIDILKAAADPALSALEQFRGVASSVGVSI